MTKGNRRLEVVLDDLAVMYVNSASGVAGAKEAFDALESKLPALRGRKFYGTYDPRTDEYRACVAVLSDDDPSRLGLPTWTIPGGLYVREKMKDWVTRIPDIGKTFVMMADREAGRVDDSRPSIEFYRSQDELILMLPILAEERATGTRSTE